MKRRDEIRARPRWRLTKGRDIALGPGKADLLEAILQRGSISAAARLLGMSYRRAWLLVQTMNRCFAAPLVATPARGAWRGSGATLTSEGRRALELYRRIEAASERAAGASLRRLTRMLGGS